MFNALSNAQKQKREAEDAGTKEKDTVKQTKSALLQILKPGAKRSETAGVFPLPSFYWPCCCQLAMAAGRLVCIVFMCQFGG